MLPRRLPVGTRFDFRTERWLRRAVEPAARGRVSRDHTFTATANAEERVRHGLGRIPEGFTVVSKNQATDVYRGTTRWTRWHAYLKSTVASSIVRVEFF